MSSRELTTNGTGVNASSDQAPSRPRMSEGHAFLAGWAFCVNYIFCTATGQTVPAIPGSSSLPPDLERASLEFINEWLEDIRYGSATVDPAEALPIPPTEYPQVPLELPEDILQYYSANNADLEETPENANVNEDLGWLNDLEPDYHTSASANTIEEFGWFAPILDELADAAQHSAPNTADDATGTGAWSQGALVQEAAAVNEDQQTQLLMAQYYQTDNASAAHPAQTSVQTIPDNNQQPQHYNYTPPSKYTPSIAHALVDDTQQTANYTHSAPLNEVQLEDMLLSDFAIPQWRDIEIPSVLPSADKTPSLAYSIPETAYQHAAQASIEQSPLSYIPQAPTPKENSVDAGIPAQSYRRVPETLPQMLPPPTPISIEKRMRKRKRTESKEASSSTSGPSRKKRNLTVSSPLKYHSPSPFNKTLYPGSPDEVAFMLPTPTSAMYAPHVGTPGPSGFLNNAAATPVGTVDMNLSPDRMDAPFPAGPSRKGKERAHPRNFQPYPDAPRVRTRPLPVIQNELPQSLNGEWTSPNTFEESAISLAPSPANIPIAGQSSYPTLPAASHQPRDQSWESSAIPAAVLNTSAPDQAPPRKTRKLLSCPLHGCDHVIFNSREQITKHVMNDCRAETIRRAKTIEAKWNKPSNPEDSSSDVKISIKCDECHTRPVASLDAWVKHIVEKHTTPQKCKRDGCGRTFDSFWELRKHSDAHRKVRQSADAQTPGPALEPQQGGPHDEHSSVNKHGGDRMLADWQVEGYYRPF